MLLPYVDPTSSMSDGNCNQQNKPTGKHVIITSGAAIQDTLCTSTSARVALNAIIVAANETNKETSPIVILLGNLERKSSSEKRAVSIPKNITTEAVEENNAMASVMIKSINVLLFKNKGFPSASFPPGSVKAPANAIMIMSAATTVHEADTSFIHCPASLSKSLCSTLKSFWGVVLLMLRAC
ncbi:hypothetical protein CTI12_AA373750 [Artemisia annua]|uniref:Uncharacterized protein n=1 Tax=Artemisia annua TaxID=35608 RepID=A0A2U1MHN8_ARTAN|nr:hypothetical protein CTI12_AA373750 [Artemisia annua]